MRLMGIRGEEFLSWVDGGRGFAEFWRVVSSVFRKFICRGKLEIGR